MSILVLRTFAVSALLASILSATAYADDGDGAAGPDYLDSTSQQTQSMGGHGEANNGTGGIGSAGGKGGDVTSEAVGNANNEAFALSFGGNGGHGDETGGAGGNGGTVNFIMTGQVGDNVDASSYGGAGGNSNSGNGSLGGSGGDVSLSVSGLIEGHAFALSSGGQGQGSTGTTGGNSGNVELTIAASSRVNGEARGESLAGDAEAGGNAGTVVVTIAGVVTNGVVAQSAGGEGSGAGGDGNDVTVTISGTVIGDVAASNSGTTVGEIKVILDGGIVTGTITASGGTSSLKFAFDVSDKSEFNAAAAVLTNPNKAAQGTVTINGALYQWSGFGSLVNALRYVGPADAVVITVTETSTSGSSTFDPAPVKTPGKPKLVAEASLEPVKPEAATCDSPTVRAIRQSDGTVLVVSRSEGKNLVVGTLTMGSFKRTANAPNWDVSFVNDGGTQVAQITDGSGHALSSCSF
jgi:hypothetical protein